MKTDHIKRRNMWVQVLLMFVTLGLYSIYWFHSTLKELHIANDHGSDSGKWALLFVVPIANFFAVWHYCGETSHFTDNKYPRLLLYILWTVVTPSGWFLTQRELNQASTAPA